ncbi:MAG: division/cell wall cluster transcriptional repressor MraZ [bacterium]|nr:division/cell wall cluster transcriptional repressor MraZ [bacterium]
MLIGEYQHTVDEKGRIALPAKFRKSLTDGVVVTKSLDPCLHIYSIEQWIKIAEKISQLPLNKSDVGRLMFSQASHCDIDSQGRILIPSSLLEKAGIKNKAVIVGMFTRGELWNEEGWRERRKSIEDKTPAFEKELGEMNLL